jgi:hydroxyacylglutathione hydrolase
MEVVKGLHAFIWQSYPDNCNTYLIDGDKKILIDPGFEQLFNHVKSQMTNLKISPDDIDVVIATHAHPDHLEAAGLFHKPTLFAMNEEEYNFFNRGAGHYLNIPEPDFFLHNGDLQIGEHEFQVIVTPGHSPGSICLYWPVNKVLFTGDLVFSRSIGRSDMPGGDSEIIKESIKKIAELDCEYILPGHRDMLVGRDVIRANFEMIENFWFNQRTASFYGR